MTRTRGRRSAAVEILVPTTTLLVSFSQFNLIWLLVSLQQYQLYIEYNLIEYVFTSQNGNSKYGRTKHLKIPNNGNCHPKTWRGGMAYSLFSNLDDDLQKRTLITSHLSPLTSLHHFLPVH